MIEKMKKWLILFSIAYSLGLTLVFPPRVEYRYKDSPRIFFQSPRLSERLTQAVSYDTNGTGVILTRIFHNKVFFALDSYMEGVFRVADPVALFSLTESPLMYDDVLSTRILFPWELILFFVALTYCIKNVNKNKQVLTFVGIAMGISLLLSGLIYPSLYPPVLVPFVISIRLFIGCGVGWAGEKLWLRK